MTERWRKKLEGIDRVGPSDDLYERAKAGPTLQEPQSPMQRTSTRVVTVIAAFVVFALAISLFAIPTLRLHEGSGTLTAAGQLLPLWPARTTDEVQALQTQADAGDAAWALDPRQVATRFGQAVLGWPDAWAGGASSFDPTCGVVQGTYPNTASPEIPCAYAAGSNAVVGIPGERSGTGIASCAPTFLLCGQATGSDASAGPQSAFLSFAVAVCDPSSCHAAPTETVELFQPMGTGGGQIWAVIEASSPSIDLGVSPGQTVREGSSISTVARIRTGDQFGFGVHVGASGSCRVDKATDTYQGPISTDGLSTSAGSELATNFGPVSGTSCQQSEPGYVFAATGGKPIVRDGVAFDPLQPGGASLYALSAVPITFEWPDEVASSEAPTPVTSIAWTTYTDPLDWTIDVPTGWMQSTVAFKDGSNIAGAAFAPEGTPHSTEGLFEPIGEGLAVSITSDPNRQPLADDDSFPLNCDLATGGQDFQGDAVIFHFSVSVGGDQITASQRVVACHMLESIHFEPWQPGDQRNGWTALHGNNQDPLAWRAAMISWQDCDASGCYVLTLGEPIGRYLLGPIKPCGDGESKSADQPHATEYVIVLGCPDGSTQRWTRAGVPASTNSPGYGAQLEKHPVVKAWDGMPLANVGETIG